MTKGGGETRELGSIRSSFRESRTLSLDWLRLKCASSLSFCDQRSVEWKKKVRCRAPENDHILPNFTGGRMNRFLQFHTKTSSYRPGGMLRTPHTSQRNGETVRGREQ